MKMVTITAAREKSIDNPKTRKPFDLYDPFNWPNTATDFRKFYKKAGLDPEILTKLRKLRARAIVLKNAVKPDKKLLNMIEKYKIPFDILEYCPALQNLYVSKYIVASNNVLVLTKKGATVDSESMTKELEAIKKEFRSLIKGEVLKVLKAAYKEFLEKTKGPINRKALPGTNI